MTESAEGCRVDVWLWRARFFKTRSLAARVIEDGRVRLTRGPIRAPLDKPSRLVRCGDVLTFAVLTLAGAGAMRARSSIALPMNSAPMASSFPVASRSVTARASRKQRSACSRK